MKVDVYNLYLTTMCVPHIALLSDIYALSSVPVSYTHLDVYKRQQQQLYNGKL